MKKFAVLAAAVLTAGVVGGSAVASGEAQTVRGFGCGVLDGNGSVIITTNSVLTVYASGKAVLQCLATGAANPTGGVVNWNFGNTGLTCGMLFAGSTTTWRNRVGANGEVQLTCETWLNNNQINAASSSAGIG